MTLFHLSYRTIERTCIIQGFEWVLIKASQKPFSVISESVRIMWKIQYEAGRLALWSNFQAEVEF